MLKEHKHVHTHTQTAFYIFFAKKQSIDFYLELQAQQNNQTSALNHRNGTHTHAHMNTHSCKMFTWKQCLGGKQVFFLLQVENYNRTGNSWCQAAMGTQRPFQNNITGRGMRVSCDISVDATCCITQYCISELFTAIKSIQLLCGVYDGFFFVLFLDHASSFNSVKILNGIRKQRSLLFVTNFKRFNNPLIKKCTCSLTYSILIQTKTSFSYCRKQQVLLRQNLPFTDIFRLENEKYLRTALKNSGHSYQLNLEQTAFFKKTINQKQEKE